MKVGSSPRVLQVMAGAEYGGAEAFFIRLVMALHRAGLEQRVVIRANPRRAEALSSAGIETVQLPFGGLFDFRTTAGLKREIRSFQPGVVLTWMNRATNTCPKGDFVHVARLGGYYNIKYYWKCDHLIGNTEEILEYLTELGWPKERAHFLPNFVAAERAQPVPREQHFTPANAPLLLALGRLHQNKAFDVLLEAMVRTPEVYLWLAGEGPLREELETLAEHLAVKPRVRFLGWREDTAALFRACDVFVCPSRHEPYGNVVVEAWAQSVPVISTDTLGPGTMIEHMETGLITPVDDPMTMSNAIRFLLNDEELRTRLAEGGRAAYEERFTEDAVVERYIQFFRDVTG